MTVQSILKRLMPPLAAYSARTERLFSSWQEAAVAAGAYTDERLNRFKAARAALRPADGSLLATNVLYLTALALGQPDLAVTDFGGACGELGRDFLTVFPQARYTVVENPVLVALMAKSGGGVQFTATPPAECDLFFSSSTLQYLEDPMAALAAGFSSARRAVIFARNSFCDTDLIRVQQSWLFDNGNGPLPPGYENVKVFYPHRTLNENAVLQSAQKHGFRCVARIEERSGVIPYRDMVYGRQLVFLRAAS